MRKVCSTRQRLRLETATISALRRLIGATRLSTKLTMSEYAHSVVWAYCASGEFSLSVMAIIWEPQSCANLHALMVLFAYLGKESPMKTSPSPMWIR